MKTIILFWNPSISNFKKKDYDKYVEMAKDPERFLDEDEVLGFNWAVWENDKAEDGDRCFMMKVGDDTPGIVFEGHLDSDPYYGSDWAERGRKVSYCDIDMGFMSPADSPILRLQQLEEEIPDFCWTGGHSGRYLTEEQSRRFEWLWQEALYKANPDERYGGMTRLRDEAAEAVIELLHGKKCDACGYSLSDMNLGAHAPYLFWPNKEDRMAAGDHMLYRVHFLCKNCECLNEGYLREQVAESQPFADPKQDHFFWSEKLELFLRVDELHNHFIKKLGGEEEGPIALERDERHRPSSYINEGQFKEISREVYTNYKPFVNK